MSATAEDVLEALEEHGTEVKSQLTALKAENAELRKDLTKERELREQHERECYMSKTEKRAPSVAASGPVPAQLCEARTGKPIPAFAHGHKMAPLLYPRETAEMPPNPIGRMLRGIVLGGRADDARQLAEERKALATIPDGAGGYTVSGALAASWVDLLRSATRLSQVGVTTVPMTTRDLTIATLLKDADAAWHAENALLADSDPTFGAVTLTARTVVGKVNFPLELSQDSDNIEQILQTSLTSALALKIDAAGLCGESEDAAIAPGGVYNLEGRNTVTSIGAPTCWDYVLDGMHKLMCANVPRSSIGGMIYHPDLWHKMAKLKTGISGDNSPLPMPEDVRRIPMLDTTANPSNGMTTKAVLGMWSDLLYGVRMQLTVQLLNQTYMGSNLQLCMLAVARVAFVATRPASFCTLEGVAVG